jgi:adenylate cyclase
MSWSFAAQERAEVDLLVSFADLTRLELTSRTLPPLKLAEWMQTHYERCGVHVQEAGGRIVKFIGDAMLAVFPAERADDGVRALLDLKRDTDETMEAAGLPPRLMVKAHYGPVVAGPYGARGDPRFDVLGVTVNTTARLETRGMSISAEAFRKLAPPTRKLFQKHTPSVVYIPVGTERP